VNIVQELSGSTPTADLLNAASDEVLTRTDGSGTSSYLADGLGSTIAVSDGSGIQTQYTYDAFAQTTTTGAPSTNPRGLAHLAHELVHVGQYRNGMTRSVLAMGLS